MKKMMKRTTTPLVIVALVFGLCLSAGAADEAKKPNILVIMGDDVGMLRSGTVLGRSSS